MHAHVHMDICRKLAMDSNVNVVYWTIVFLVINKTFTLVAENREWLQIRMSDSLFDVCDVF